MRVLFGPRPGLPKTGQVTEYQAGDDGTYQKGWPVARFIDRGNGTVHDNATRLQWVKQPELIIPGAIGVHASNQVQVAGGIWAADADYAAATVIFDAVGGVKFYVSAVAHHSGLVSLAADIAAHPTWWRETIWTASAANLTTPATMTWADAITACEALVYAGFNDWRLPNLFEMMTLLNYGAADVPMTYPEFTNTKVGVSGERYWSSTTAGNYTSQAAYVNFNLYHGISEKTSTDFLYVRPVRGGI